jgi:hypothetical protein
MLSRKSDLETPSPAVGVGLRVGVFMKKPMS